MSRCCQETIGSGFFAYSPNIVKLKMVYCRQSTICNDFLDGLSLLKLDMSSCVRETIGNGFLAKQNKLQKLNMAYCCQKTIKNGFLDGLTSLRVLYMRMCN